MDCARSIQIPILAVRGRMSDVITEEAARDFVTLVPNASFSDVAEAAHMVAGDRNDAFTAEVAGFLDGLD
jgi:pimeloyl-ACP methyl ester carboxylesterase